MSNRHQGPDEAQELPAHELRVVQKLLWVAVCEHLPPAERDEVRRAIGGHLVQENEDLFNEASCLAQVLGQVRTSLSAVVDRQAVVSSGQNAVVKDIQRLLGQLWSTASCSPFNNRSIQARDPESVLPQGTDKDKEVLDFMAAQQSADGRPLTPLSRPGSAGGTHRTVTRPGTGASRPDTALSSVRSAQSRPSTGMSRLSGGMSRPTTADSGGSGRSGSLSSAPLEVVSELKDKLNVYDIDSVREHIRSALADERTALMEDIEFLQALVLDEADQQPETSQAPPVAPSEADLVEYKEKLSRVVEQEEQRVDLENQTASMFAGAASQKSHPGRLRSITEVSRQCHADGSVTLHSGSGASTQTLCLDDAGADALGSSERARGAGASTSLTSPPLGVPGGASSSLAHRPLSSASASAVPARRPSLTSTELPQQLSLSCSITDWPAASTSAAAQGTTTPGDCHHDSHSSSAPRVRSSSRSRRHEDDASSSADLSADPRPPGGLTRAGSTSSDRGLSHHHGNGGGGAMGASVGGSVLENGRSALSGGGASIKLKPLAPRAESSPARGSPQPPAVSVSPATAAAAWLHPSVGSSGLNSPVASAADAHAAPFATPLLSAPISAAGPSGSHACNGVRLSDGPVRLDRHPLGSVPLGAAGMSGSPRVGALFPDRRSVRSVTQYLEAEMDAVQGGVSAILAKHGYKAPSAGSGAAGKAN